MRHEKHTIFSWFRSFIGDRLMADKTAFGPISIASWFVIFNGSSSRRRISCRRFPGRLAGPQKLNVGPR
jgi:hypothetical protein